MIVKEYFAIKSTDFIQQYSDKFAADSGWSEYSQYFEVATGND